MTYPNTVALGDVVRHRKEFVTINDLAIYRRPRVQLHARGVVLRDAVPGALIKTKQQQVCLAREFLVAEIDAKVGGFGMVPGSLAGAIVSSHYFLFELDESRLDSRFLDLYIRTPLFKEQVEAQGSTNYAAIRPSDVLAYRIPLPSLPEQHRVIARVEELADRINEARALRDSSEEVATSLSRARLGEVFTGLARQYPIVNLETLCSDIVDGPHQTPNYLVPGAPGVPFVTVRNMVTGRLDLNTENRISETDHRLYTRRCAPSRGDVLYSKDGATRGQPCLVDTDAEFSFFVSVALIKPLRDQLDSGFLVHFLNSSWIRDRMAEKSRGDMIPHIVLREIRAFPLPHLPFPEQRRVAAVLDTFQAEMAKLRCAQAETVGELDALLPAILDRVFKGEL